MFYFVKIFARKIKYVHKKYASFLPTTGQKSFILLDNEKYDIIAKKGGNIMNCL